MMRVLLLLLQGLLAKLKRKTASRKLDAVLGFSFANKPRQQK